MLGQDLYDVHDVAGAIDGQAAAHAEDFGELHAEVYADPPYRQAGNRLTRSTDDPLAFRQTMSWESRSDFERYWYSEEIEHARAAIIDLYDIPLLPSWHILVAAE